MQEKPNKTKLKGLDFLAFIRPNWGFSMRYDQSKQFFSDALRTLFSAMRQRSGLARRHPHASHCGRLIHSCGDHDILISSFPEAIVLKN
jgi:hypothetical protein